VAIVKGPSLAVSAYGDAGCRSYSDIDICVRSEVDARQLVRALPDRHVQETDQSSFIERLRDPGKIHLHGGGLTIEIAFPLVCECDPMLSLLHHNAARLLRVPASADALLSPDPTIHFIFLILHMTVNHWFSRLIWFVDLAALWRAASARIDLDLVRQELKRLGWCSAAASALDFGRRHFGADLPFLPMPADHGWHRQFLERLTSPDTVVNQKISYYHGSWPGRLMSRTLWTCGFTILTDADDRGRRLTNHATRSSYERVFLALRVERQWIKTFLRILTFIPLFLTVVVARVASFIWLHDRYSTADDKSTSNFSHDGPADHPRR
jgi:hypothetical protein